MTLPHVLSSEVTDRLRALAPPQQTWRDPTGERGAEREQPGTEPVVASRLVRALGTGRRLRVPTAAGVRRRVEQRLLAPSKDRVRERVERIARRQVEPLEDRLASREQEVAQLRADLSRSAALRVVPAVDARQIEANRINLELLKGEFRSLLATVEELGMAMAPATGLAGAGKRFAELRESVHALERKVRAGSASADPGPDGALAPAGAPPVSQPTSALFDYVGFERRFRGDPAEVLALQEDRYADLLASHGPVLDVGCGRGELLELLASRGVDVLGVDTDPGMVIEARERGLQVDQADVLAWLRQRPEHSLGAIFSAHVAEHLELDALLEFIDLAHSRLVPGGVFVAETPNPASLIVLGNSYILDPTHVRPLHPSLLSFFCENAGFRDVRLRFFSPAEGYHLPRLDEKELPEWAVQVNVAFDRLNEVLFGAQEYAVVATTRPAD